MQPDRILRRRPQTVWNAAALLEKIREMLVASPFYVEDARAAADARSAIAGALPHVPKPEDPHTGTSSPRDPTKSGPATTP
jgi:hypothetical protein